MLPVKRQLKFRLEKSSAAKTVLAPVLLYLLTQGIFSYKVNFGYHAL